MIAGFLLALTAAGGSDTESMSCRSIIIAALLGLSLMVIGDRLIHSKRKRPARKVDVNVLSDRRSCG